MEWISVKDRLPETFDNVLVALNDETILMATSINDVWRLFWLDGYKTFYHNDGRQVTHWMPLPSPPSIEKP